MTANTTDSITWETVIDILNVLEAHGFRKSTSSQDVGRAVGMIAPLVRAYTGAGDDQ